MKNLSLIAATALIVGASSMVASAAELDTRQWLVALNASPIKAVESPVITAAVAWINTPHWLVALNASPIKAVESPVITAAVAWINGTPPAVGVMAYGPE
jgi:hypothetical protein